MRSSLQKGAQRFDRDHYPRVTRKGRAICCGRIRKRCATGNELLVDRHPNNVDSQAGAARDVAHPAAGSIPALSRNPPGQRGKERLFRWRTERRYVWGSINRKRPKQVVLSVNGRNWRWGRCRSEELRRWSSVHWWKFKDGVFSAVW